MNKSMLVLLMFGTIWLWPVKAMTDQDFFLFKQYVCTQDGNFYFKDLAIYNSKLQSIWNELGNKLVFYLPDSREYRIEKKDLLDLLHQAIGKKISLCVLPDYIIAKRAQKVFSPLEIQQKVQSFFLSKLSSYQAKIEFRGFQFFQPVFLDQGDKIELKAIGRVKPGRNGFRLTVLDGYNHSKRIYTGSIFVDVWKNVPVIIKPVARKQPLSPANVGYALKNMAYVQGKIWNGKDFNYKAKVSLGLGEVITLNKLEPLSVINRKDKIKMVYQTRLIQIETIGQALEDGRLGDMINVRNLDSKRIVRCRVAAKGLVACF